jgi:surface antigen
MYVDGQPTTIEMLASSNNLSEFFDKEAYRVDVQTKIQSTLLKIADLQKQLKSQKDQVDQLLAEQASQRAQLDGARAQQAGMLTYNQGQQSNYNAQTASNQARLQQLIEEQRRANGNTASYYFLRFPGTVASHDTSVNDYPYAGAGFGMSTAPGCVDNDGPDQWGYCTRQCVSYAAWAVERSGRAAPRYYGNAKDWVNAARNSGVGVYTANPKPGDVAISTAGTWGHAMYVEQVNGNQILVSQYNQQLTGQYSTQWRTWY